VAPRQADDPISKKSSMSLLTKRQAENGVGGGHLTSGEGMTVCERLLFATGGGNYLVMDSTEKQIDFKTRRPNIARQSSGE
jgi:hypothetical protein